MDTSLPTPPGGQTRPTTTTTTTTTTTSTTSQSEEVTDSAIQNVFSLFIAFAIYFLY